MIGGMGRGKAGIPSAVFYNEPGVIGNVWIPAWAKPVNIFLDDLTADRVCKGNCNDDKQHPEPSPQSKIFQDEDQ